MDNLRVITMLGAFGGGVVSGGGGSNSAPAPLEELKNATHICNGKRYILRASDFDSETCKYHSMANTTVCDGAQAEIWLDNDEDTLLVDYPSTWLWSTDGKTYAHINTCGGSSVHAPESKCGYRQVITLRHDGQAVLANLAYQYDIVGAGQAQDCSQSCCGC